MTTLNPSAAQGDDNPLLMLVQRAREVRRRLLIIAAAIGATLTVTWSLSDYVMAFIERPLLAAGTHLQFDTLTDPFFTHFKAAISAAVFLTFPLTLVQLWRFVAPALHERQKRVIYPFLLLSFPAFVGGGLFCYSVVYPPALRFLIHFDSSLLPSLRVGDYVSFTLTLMFTFGLVFEMPLVSVLLTRMGLIDPKALSINRRYAIVLVFVFAAVITPSEDAFTQCLLAGPMLILYEISVLVARLARPRAKPKPDASEG
ncbi:MAG TPA: twin-arginine translocase subunit TatC [bacterium]|nr:twin-arginine translocase subunit TatC [bacterium]